MIDSHIVRCVVSGRVSQAGLPVSNQNRHGDTSWRGDAHHLQGLILALSFTLIASVLKPDFHLSGGEFEHIGQMISLRSREIFLLLEASLELVHLRLREEDARLPSFPLFGTIGILQFKILARLFLRAADV